MVAAGVYLVARLFPMFALSKDALMVVALLGGFTAFFAATIGLVMNDIKRVLAYSTVSQLGYMIMALGVGGYTAGVFHLMTHAYFKALLFLGSGSVIHSMHSALHHNPELDPQDMRNMGGLSKFMPTTYVTFWIGTLALAGIFPFAGFWSKDEILADCMKWASAGDILHWLPYAFGACAAFMTAFYMGRLMFLTFHGKYRGKGHPHESPLAITIPLIVLAVFSVGAGFLGTPWANRFHHLIHYTPPAAVMEVKSGVMEAGEGTTAGHGGRPALQESVVANEGAVVGVTPALHEIAESTGGEGAAAEGEKAEGPNWLVMIISTIIAVAGLLLSALFYFWNTFSHEAVKKKILPIHTLLYNKYYVDEFVQLVFMKGGWVFISGLRLFDMYVVDGLVNLVGWLGKMWSVIEGWCDKWIVDGLVNLVGIIVKTVGGVARKIQTGYVQNYIFIIVLGVILILLLR
jgi:NADH-quinone oxidoreductase subunit L